MGRGRFVASCSVLLALAFLLVALPAQGTDTVPADTGLLEAESALLSATTLATESLAQEEPAVTLTTLASATIGALPEGPLRWRVFDAQLPVGGRTPLEAHAPALFYAIEGMASLVQEGVTVSFGPGSGGFVEGGLEHFHANVGKVPARVLVFYLEAADRPVPPDPPPVLTILASEQLQAPRDRPYTMTLSLVEARPGPVPTHIHPGPTLPFVLEGSIEHTLGGVTTTRRAGDAWLEQPGVVSSGRFSGRMAVRILVAQLLPQGEPFLIPVE